MTVPSALSALQELCRDIVFGNGWLALAGFAAVCAVTAVVRLGRGIQV